MNWDAFLDALRTWLDQHGLLAREAAWVVGVSGGPDSTLLLHALLALARREGLGWSVHVAHLNHALRGEESDGDQQFVAALAARLDTLFHCERVDVRHAARARGVSIEAAARQARYDFLERVAVRVGSGLVAVGHHADDNAETVLHRICRGTGLRGLGGIADVRPIRAGSDVRLVRPLLPYSKDAIARLCGRQGFETRADSSNATTEFTRNRIRHAVLPFLRETLNPGVSDALQRLAEQARWTADYLHSEGARGLERVIVAQAPDVISVSVPGLRTHHRAVQAEIVRQVASRLAGSGLDLGFDHVVAILSIAEDAAGGKSVNLPHDIRVRRHYDRIEFRRARAETEPPRFDPIAVQLPGRTPLPALGVTLVAEERAVDATSVATLRRDGLAEDAWLADDQLQPPLLVRGRCTGDRFHPLGAPGSRSVADFLSDHKIEPDRRSRVAVVCDQRGPVWVMPLRIDERVKLRESTRRAWHLVVEPREGVP